MTRTLFPLSGKCENVFAGLIPIVLSKSYGPRTDRSNLNQSTTTRHLPNCGQGTDNQQLQISTTSTPPPFGCQFFHRENKHSLADNPILVPTKSLIDRIGFSGLPPLRGAEDSQKRVERLDVVVSSTSRCRLHAVKCLLGVLSGM